MQSLRGAGSGFGVRGFGSAATGFRAHRLRPVRCKMRSLSGHNGEVFRSNLTVPMIFVMMTMMMTTSLRF